MAALLDSPGGTGYSLAGMVAAKAASRASSLFFSNLWGAVNLIGCKRNEAVEHADSYASPTTLVISVQA